MPRAYSADLRARVLDACAAAEVERAEIARRFRISESTLYGWWKQWKEEERRTAKPHAGGSKRQIDPALLRSLLEEKNDRTGAEMATLYQERTDRRIHPASVSKILRREGISRKKKTLRASEQGREDVVQARQQFWQEVATIPREDLVFVDESGISTTMTRRYGRSPVGERAHGRVPAGSWTQLTLLGGLSLQGLVACMSIETATDTPVFVAFVRHVLAPALKPGQVVILDNLSPHKAAEVRSLIEGAGCRLLLLPPYSPDLNPIEQAWSKLKALLRSAAARTKKALESALTALIDEITAADAHSYFAHCGYA